MEYIRDGAGLEAMAVRIGDAPLVGVDTEAAGYHRYFDRVCVVQVSTRAETFVIDTLAVSDLTPLRPLLADPAVEVVFHDADYDLRLMDRDFGIGVGGLFDTKIAAQFLGEPAIGLASLVEKYLGVKLEKKYQRADWAQRPLPAGLVEYAAEDTRYLPALRDRLRDELRARGRLGWAEEEFRIQETVRWSGNGADPDAYLRVKGTRDLLGRNLAAFRELYAWREALARERDVAPFRVISNEALIEIARAMPRSAAQLAELAGVPRAVAERHRPDLLAAVERARQIPERELPVRPRGPGRPAPDPAFDERLERLKVARDRVAEKLGLDRGFLMPRAQLEEIARAEPRTLEQLAALPGLRRWQVEAAGEPIVRALG